MHGIAPFYDNTKRKPRIESHVQSYGMSPVCGQELNKIAFRNIKEIKRSGALRSALKFSLPTLAGSAPVDTRAGQ